MMRVSATSDCALPPFVCLGACSPPRTRFTARAPHSCPPCPRSPVLAHACDRPFRAPLFSLVWTGHERTNGCTLTAKYVPSSRGSPSFTTLLALTWSRLAILASARRGAVGASILRSTPKRALKSTAPTLGSPRPTPCGFMSLRQLTLRRKTHCMKSSLQQLAPHGPRLARSYPPLPPTAPPSSGAQRASLAETPGL